jgi:LmbE family N-acetylglucosaminyl deacetylase
LGLPAAPVDCLYLSPHLDDAVLSCALRILREVRQGTRVAIATLFTRGCHENDDEDYLEGRRNEDRAALNALGVGEPIHLGYPDAPFRSDFYSSGAAIVTREHRSDRVFSEELSAKVAWLYKELAARTIYLPWAVGTHIDHRLTFGTWATLPPSAEIIFYEDRPYSFLPYNLALRLRQLGVTVFGDNVSGLPLPAISTVLSEFHAGLSTVSLYKNMGTTRMERFLYALNALPCFFTPPPKSRLRVRSEVLDTSATDDIKQIQAAIAAYESQVPILFTDMDTFAHESASYAAVLASQATYAERYWRLVR